MMDAATLFSILTLASGEQRDIAHGKYPTMSACLAAKAELERPKGWQPPAHHLIKRIEVRCYRHWKFSRA